MQRIIKLVKPLFANREKRLLQTLFCVAISAFLGLAWLQLGHPIFIVILCLLPLAGLFVLNTPFLMIMLFIIFSFFRVHEVFPFLAPLKLPLLLALGSIVSISWGVFIKKTIDPFFTKELGLLLIFFILVCVGVLFASNREVALETIINTYSKVFIMVFFAAWATTKPHLYPIIIRSFCVCGIVLGVVTLYNQVNGLELVEGTRVTIGRSIGSMLGDPNDLSLVLLFPVGFALAFLMTKNNRKTDWLLGFITVSILFFAVLATQSRGGLLGFIAVCGIYGFYKVKNKMLLIPVAILAIGVLFTLAGIDDRASGGAHEEGIDESAMGRLHAWMAAVRMAIANPLTGVGIHNFYYNYFDYSSYWDGKNYVVHSTWFGVLAETGLLGMAIFLTMIGLCLKGLINCVRITKNFDDKHHNMYLMSLALLSAFTGFIISGTFLTMGFTWPLYIILALSIALQRCVYTTQRELLSK